MVSDGPQYYWSADLGCAMHVTEGPVPDKVLVDRLNSAVETIQAAYNQPEEFRKYFTDLIENSQE